MRRKILMGVLALALPVGTVAAVSSPAFAGGKVDNPTHCAGFTGTVTFNPPLTPNGVVTTSNKGNATTVTTGSFTCTPGGTASVIGNTLAIVGAKNTKNPNFNKKSCKAAPTNTSVCDKYVEGTWAEFTSAGGSLKKSLKTIPFTLGTFSAKSSSLVLPGGACGSGGVGFNITGQVKSGTYYNKHSAAVLACLTTDTHSPSGSGTFIGDYGVYNGVATAQIGGASNAVL